MKRYKIFKKIRNVFIFIMFFIFCGCIIFLINGYIEYKPVRNKIEDFKNRGVFVQETYINEQKVNCFKVPLKYDYEDAEANIFDPNSEKLYIGSKTDIIVTNRNPMRGYRNAFISDFCGYLSKEFFIGHATMVISEDGSKIIEAVGNSDTDNGVLISFNNWIITEVNNENDEQTFLCLRIKNIDDKKKEKIIADIIEKEGCKYNFVLPIPSTNKYYCTDIISRTLNKNGININYDLFYPTGNDFILTDNVYIVYVCEKDKRGKFNMYYLCKE